jgi:hypothetical protein
MQARRTPVAACRALGRGALYWKKNRTFAVFTPHDPMKKTVTRSRIIRPNLILSLLDLTITLNRTFHQI